MSFFQVGKSAYSFTQQGARLQANSALFTSGKNSSTLFNSGKKSSVPSVRQQANNPSAKNQLVRSLESQHQNTDTLGSVGSGLSDEERKKRIHAVQARNTFKSTTQAKQASGYMDLKATNNTQNTPKKKINYDAKAISSAISQAKTSLSAGKVVIKAKRKIMELKRALVRGDSDKDEIMVAINHAKQMERIAKKKKHHLELEELVEATQKMDEKINPEEGKGSDSSGFSNTDFIELAKDKIDDAREQIIKESEANTMPEDMPSLSEEMISDFSDDMSSLSEEMMIDFSDDMSSFSEEMSSLATEALERLDETMELLENLEVVDPHMSEEDLKKLKTKHRNSEEKDLVKADMNYLKDMIKLTIEKDNAQMNGLSGITSVPVANPTPAPAFIDISV